MQSHNYYMTQLHKAIVFFLLLVLQTRRSQLKPAAEKYWRDCEIPTKGRIGYRKHCREPDDRRGRHAGGYHCQTEFEYQCKNLKNK